MWNEGAVIVGGEIRQAPMPFSRSKTCCRGINKQFMSICIRRRNEQKNIMTRQLSVFAAVFLGLTPLTAFAYAPSLGEAQQSTPPDRMSFLVTFGAEQCPKADGAEIIVCAAQPEGDRYRIPKPLREEGTSNVAGGSWTSAVESLDSYARAILPNSCSVNGSNGFTGCLQQALQIWQAELRGVAIKR